MRSRLIKMRLMLKYAKVTILFCPSQNCVRGGYDVHDLGPLVLRHHQEVGHEGSEDVLERGEPVVQVCGLPGGEVFHFPVVVEERFAGRVVGTLAAELVLEAREHRPVGRVEWHGRGPR
jgi:hypothetical protein